MVSSNGTIRNWISWVYSNTKEIMEHKAATEITNDEAVEDTQVFKDY